MKSILKWKFFFNLLFLFQIENLCADYLYVPNNTDSTVSVINTATNLPIATISSINSNTSIAITPNALYGYVGQSGAPGFVSVINLTTNTFITTVTVGTNPAMIAVTTNGSYVYANNAATANISIINTSTNTLAGTITLADGGGQAIAMTPNGQYAYAASGNTIAVINLSSNTVATTIPTGFATQSIAIGQNGLYCYTVQGASTATPNYVTVIDLTTNAIVATVQMGSSNQAISAAVTPNCQYVYVVDINTQPTGGIPGTVAVIRASTNTIVATVTVGSRPRGIAISRNGSYVYVGNRSTNNVSVISTATNTVTATITVGNGPTNGSTMGIGVPHSAFILDNQNGNAYIIDETYLATPVISVSLGNSTGPYSIVLTADRSRAYVADNSTNTLSYVALDYESLYPTALASGNPITVGNGPAAMVLSSDSVYVVNSTDKTISRVALSNNAVTQIGSFSVTPGNLGYINIGGDTDYLLVSLPTLNQVAVIRSPASGSPATTTLNVGSLPSAFAFNSPNAFVTCENSNDVYSIALSASPSVAGPYSLGGITPCAISPIRISGNPYFLIVFRDSAKVSLFDPSGTPAQILLTDIDKKCTQIITNPTNLGVAYLLYPGTNGGAGTAGQLQSIDYTGTTTTPTVGATGKATGNYSIGGGCRANGTQVYVLNALGGSVSLFTTGGTNQRVLSDASPATITGLGTPSGISLCP